MLLAGYLEEEEVVAAEVGSLLFLMNLIRHFASCTWNLGWEPLEMAIKLVRHHLTPRLQQMKNSFEIAFVNRGGRNYVRGFAVASTALSLLQCRRPLSTTES